MAKLVKPAAAMLGLLLALSRSVSSAAPVDPAPSFRDESVSEWCVLLINGTVIPDAPNVYLWAVRDEAVGWCACPPTPDSVGSFDSQQVLDAAPSSSSSFLDYLSSKQNQESMNNWKGLQQMDAWWPYPPPPKQPGRTSWHVYSGWPQRYREVFPRWQVHQPVGLGSISEEGLKLEEERRLRRPWLAVEDWKDFERAKLPGLSSPAPAPVVFGTNGEDEYEDGEDGELVFGLPFYDEDGNENEMRRQVSKVKRDVPAHVEEEPNGATETVAVDSGSQVEAVEIKENLAEEHHHHHHHHEEIMEDATAEEKAEGHDGHEGHNHHGPMCDWSFWEPVIGVLVILVGLWWFLVRKGRAGFGGLGPGFALHKPAWMSSLGGGFGREKGGDNVDEASRQAMLVV